LKFNTINEVFKIEQKHYEHKDQWQEMAMYRE